MALPTASDNAFPSLLLNETTAPSAPAASKRRLYVDANHVLRWIDSGSVDSPIAAVNKWDATVAPAVTDDSGDGYAVGSRWIDVTGVKEYVCLDATVGAAVWTETTASGGITQSYLGKTSAGASFDSGASSNHLIRAKKITMATAGLIASIGVNAKGDVTRACTYTVHIWDDNAGAPGKVVASSDSSEANQGLLMSTTARYIDVGVGFWATAADWWIGFTWFGNVGGTAFEPSYDTGGGDYEATMTGSWSIDSLSSGSKNYAIRATVLR